MIQNPGFLPDHPQNWTTCSCCHSRHSQKFSERSVHNFLSYLANRQTDRQTNKLWQKHNLLGGGNNVTLLNVIVTVLDWPRPICNKFTMMSDTAEVGYIPIKTARRFCYTSLPDTYMRMMSVISTLNPAVCSCTRNHIADGESETTLKYWKYVDPVVAYCAAVLTAT